MIVARLDGVSHGFGSDDVLHDVSVTIHDDRRLGVVGANGSGKTTLFRLLARELEPERGTVWVKNGCRIGMVRQIPDFVERTSVETAARAVFSALDALAARAETVRAELASVVTGGEEERSLLGELDGLDERFRRGGGFEIDFRLRTVLSGLGFDEAARRKPVQALSGGEKNRLMLARLLLCDADLYLLDEPTNHLDLDALEWLEGYLRSREGGLSIVSHDRFFLEAVTDETLVLGESSVRHYPFPYARAMAARAEALELQAKRYVLQKREIARQETFIAKNIAGQNTRQAQARRRALEKLERVERPEREARATRIRLEPEVAGGKVVLTAEGVAVDIAGRTLLTGVDLHLRRGDRVGVLGPNGSGKTTLLCVLAGLRPPASGVVTPGAGIRPDLLDQELRSLHDENTVLLEVHALRPTAPAGEMRSYLARFLFTGDDVEKPVRALSGGERCRVALAKLFLGGANLLFLDEPTNHLDIDGREALERALADYTGTVVAVSHDRAFLNAFARSILHVHDGRADLHRGGFDAFRARLAGSRGAAVARAGAPPSGAERHEARKANKRARAREGREIERKRRRLAAIEKEMAGLERRLESLVGEMSDPSLAPDGLLARTAEHRETEAARARLTAEWESLIEALD